MNDQYDWFSGLLIICFYDFFQCDMLVSESDCASLPLQMYGIFRAVMKACVAVFAVVGEDDTVCHCNIVCGADLRAAQAVHAQLLDEPEQDLVPQILRVRTPAAPQRAAF